MEMSVDNNSSAVIDHDLGLKLAGNKPELAAELLKMLVDELPEMKNALLTAHASKDFATIAKVAHKLHGGAAYCGVPRLKSAAAMLENALKTNASESKTIDTSLKTLLSEAEQVLDYYATS